MRRMITPCGWFPLWLPLLSASLGACEPRVQEPRANPSAQATPSPRLTAETVTTVETQLASVPPDRLPLKQRVMHTGDADGNDTLPWIVALHGLGDSPRNFSTLFDGFGPRAHVFVLEAPMRRGPRGFDWLGVSVRDQEQTLVKALVKTAQLIARQIETLSALDHTRGKPVVTGFSQGGMLSFTIAARYPQLVAGAVPVAGWLPHELLPTRSSAVDTTPTMVALHGEADPVIRVGRARASVSALAAVGYNVRLQTYPQVKHRIPPPVLAALHQSLEAMLHESSQR